MSSRSEYLKEGETILVEKEINKKRESLVCTDTRFIHFGKNEVTDIGLDSICVIKTKYHPFPTAEAILGVGTILFGLIIILQPGVLGPLQTILEEATRGIGIIFLLLGGIALYEGYRLYGNELVIDTPAGRYEFEATKGMEQFAHAVRGQHRESISGD